MGFKQTFERSLEPLKDLRNLYIMLCVQNSVPSIVLTVVVSEKPATATWLLLSCFVTATITVLKIYLITSSTAPSHSEISTCMRLDVGDFGVYCSAVIATIYLGKEPDQKFPGWGWIVLFGKLANVASSILIGLEFHKKVDEERRNTIYTEIEEFTV